MIKETLIGGVIVGVIVFLLVVAPTLFFYLGMAFGFWVVSFAIGTLISEVLRERRLDRIGRKK